MRKLLGLAMIALLVMTYTSDPEAVKTGMAGVSALGRDIFRAAVGAVGDGSASSDSGGSVQQLPDGSWVRVPPGFVLPDAATPTTAKVKGTP